MNSNEFIYWLKGIVDSNDFMPTKKTWDLIVDVVSTVKSSKKETTPLNDAVVYRINELNSSKLTPNPYEITCDTYHTERKNNPLKNKT